MRGLAVRSALALVGIMPPGDHAELSLSPPIGWVEEAGLGAPDLSQTPQSRVSEWRVWGSPPGANAGRLVAACFETPTESWAPEAEGLALGKMAQLASWTAARAEQPGEPMSRELLAFVRTEEGHVLTSCFALCTDRRETVCTTALATARIGGPVVAAPAPSWGVRLLLHAIHHPALAAGGFAGIVCLGAAVVILTRKRPRTTLRKAKET